MENKTGFTITNRDRVLYAWQSSVQLVRDYESYAHELEGEDTTLSELFGVFAENEAEHAAKLLTLLQGYETGNI